ncbi:hypothetical protein [Streptomyces sp. AC495_CC817]|uniref:hypothetical protein n=1 Tax=Streptomyces sp. AC495_CC817 TaxID=2823900 RepID=UPI001C252D5C|nr:hypothetical protein [Streptomyces sp. AC495_CC817]
MRNRRVAEEILTALKASEAATNAQSTQGNAGTQVLAEAMQNIMAMIGREDEGWELFLGGDRDERAGLTLDELKKWESKLQEFEAANAWGKRGLSLRDSYINQDEIQYEGIREGGSGRGENVRSLIDHPLNQRAFFGRGARRRREGRLYHSGFALWIGNDETKMLEAIPLNEITHVLEDRDHSDIIWAYRREWKRRGSNGKMQTMKRWYFVDAYKHEQTDTVKISGVGSEKPKDEMVETGYTAFDMHANSIEGWKFGVPDALAAYIWTEIAKGLYMDGVDVSEASASILYKASAGTAKGSQNASVQFATPQTAGSTTVLGNGSDLVAMNSAKSAYDFSTIREVVALIATAIDVSVIHLTANPGDAGSSYGASQTLDLPTRLAMTTRRAEHVELDTRVLRWMAGSATAAAKIKVYFPPLVDPAETYREAQTAVLFWLEGVVDPEVFQKIASRILGVPELGALSAGLLRPNDRDSLPRKDVDKDGSAARTASSPTQGRSNGVGGAADKSTDTRGDILA